MSKQVMTKEEIFQKVKDILVDKLGKDKAGEATEKSNVIEDLGADSLDVAELVMDLEPAFGISIPDDEAEAMKTVGDIVAAIEAKLKA